MGSSICWRCSTCCRSRRWTVGRVTYATLNVQGSCNNLCDTSPDAAEWAGKKGKLQYLQR